MKKCDREIMEILEAFDSTGCTPSAAALSGVDAKTVLRYVAARDAGRPLDGAVSGCQVVRADTDSEGYGRNLENASLIWPLPKLVKKVMHLRAKRRMGPVQIAAGSGWPHRPCRPSWSGRA